MAENYTKIDVAEAHLRTAVKLFFEDGEALSIHLLGASVREILATIGESTSVRTMLHGIAKDYGFDLKTLYEEVSKHIPFLKYADRDRDAEPTDFSEASNENLLMVACKDFGRIATRTPTEVQVFEAWFLARQPPGSDTDELAAEEQEFVASCRALFPSTFHGASRDEQKQMGLALLRKKKRVRRSRSGS